MYRSKEYGQEAVHLSSRSTGEIGTMLSVSRMISRTDVNGPFNLIFLECLDLIFVLILRNI